MVSSRSIRTPIIPQNLKLNFNLQKELVVILCGNWIVRTWSQWISLLLACWLLMPTVAMPCDEWYLGTRRDCCIYALTGHHHMLRIDMTNNWYCNIRNLFLRSRWYALCWSYWKINTVIPPLLRFYHKMKMPSTVSFQQAPLWFLVRQVMTSCKCVYQVQMWKAWIRKTDQLSQRSTQLSSSTLKNDQFCNNIYPPNRFLKLRHIVIPLST